MKRTPISRPAGISLSAGFLSLRGLLSLGLSVASHFVSSPLPPVAAPPAAPCALVW